MTKTIKRNSRPDIYIYKKYRDFINDWVSSSAIQRGQRTMMSTVAKVHKTTLSQIFKGSKEFSLEQAYRLAEYFGLGSDETDYFILLVNMERSASSELKNYFQRQISKRQKDRLELSRRVSKSSDLSLMQSSTYYSNWIYSAVRNLTAIESFREPHEIGNRLGVPVATIKNALDFLLQTGLCEVKEGQARPGTPMTHLKPDSPMISRHHANWRIKAMNHHPALRSNDELTYTAVMTLSETDVHFVRSLLADLVQRVDEVVAPSHSEKLYAICLDWFEVN